MIRHVIFGRQGEADKLTGGPARPRILRVQPKPIGLGFENGKPLGVFRSVRHPVRFNKCHGGRRRVVILGTQAEIIVIDFAARPLGRKRDNCVQRVNVVPQPAEPRRTTGRPQPIKMILERRGCNLRIRTREISYGHDAPPVPPTNFQTRQWQ